MADQGNASSHRRHCYLFHFPVFSLFRVGAESIDKGRQTNCPKGNKNAIDLVLAHDLVYTPGASFFPGKPIGIFPTQPGGDYSPYGYLVVFLPVQIDNKKCKRGNSFSSKYNRLIHCILVFSLLSCHLTCHPKEIIQICRISDLSPSILPNVRKAKVTS